MSKLWMNQKARNSPSLSLTIYLGMVCLILFVAALASLIPAVRAARVEPVQVLRDE